MTTSNADLATDSGLSKRFHTISKINITIDEIHIALKLLNLVEAGAAQADQDGIAECAIIIQGYIERSLSRLVEARVDLGGPGSGVRVAA